MIYLDHAAYPWPRPLEPGLRLARRLLHPGSSSDWAVHRERAAAALADLLHAAPGSPVIFTRGARPAFDCLLTSLRRPGDHLLTSRVEHEAVMQPLYRQVPHGVTFTTLPLADSGAALSQSLLAALRPATRAVIWSQASNVVGAIQPVQALAAALRERGILLIVDAAQTTGVLPIHFERLGADALVFSGHKGLHGPFGSGGLVCRSAELAHQVEAELSRRAASQPSAAALQSLAEGIEAVLQQGVSAIRQCEMDWMARLLSGLAALPGVTLYGPREAAQRVGLVCFNLAGLPAGQVQAQLAARFNVFCRAGLHQAPCAHLALGTWPGGAVRFAVGATNTVEEIDFVVAAVRVLAARPTE